jgi:PKD repeat protein
LAHAVYVFDVNAATQPPVASFTSAPPSGDAPLTVQFSDTSTGDVTRWLWEFGDGLTSDERHPAHLYSGAGTYAVTLTATNAHGSGTARGTVEVAAPSASNTNLIVNPHFETGTEGWDSNGFTAVTLERVAGGQSSAWSAKVTNTGTGPVSATLNDIPNTVSRTSAGTYTASIWVRSGSGTAGARLYLRMREYQGSTKLNETVAPVTLTSSWQQVTASLTPTAAGSSAIDLGAVVFSAPAGAAYFADEASLVFR